MERSGETKGSRRTGPNRVPTGPGYRGVMDRRLAGIIVLILVVVTATVAPTIGGRRVAGSAVAKVFPEPPGFGDCAVAPLPGSPESGRPTEFVATDITWGPCTGGIAGEIVGLRGRDTLEDAQGGPTRGWCFRQAAEFAGLDTAGSQATVRGAPNIEGISWAPTVGFDARRVVPGDDERRAGQTWVACLVVPIAPVTYHGTVGRGFESGMIPDEFGLCWDGTDLDRDVALIGCDRPHPAELLATGRVYDRSAVATADITQSCRQMAAAIMGVGDPTAGGELVTVIDPVQSDGARAPNAPQSVGCFVAASGSRQLGGTLIGLGGRSVPFAS